MANDKRYKEYDKGHIHPEKMLSHLSSVEGYTRWANSHNFRKHINLENRIREVKRCFKITQSIANLKMTSS